MTNENANTPEGAKEELNAARCSHKIMETLESARDGFNQAHMSFAEKKDLVGVRCMRAHHESLNRLIVEMGNESVTLPDLEFLI
jgi:hypothetical protein